MGSDSMNIPSTGSESSSIHNLKWLMFFRLLFTSLLLGSTIVLQLRESPSPMTRPLVVLYGLTGGIFVLSFLYTAIINRIQRTRHQQIFAYIQTGLDTLIVTLIIYVTGGYSSIFSFLYLLIIIYSAILLFNPGTMIIAALCSIQYGLLIDLEYYGLLKPFTTDLTLSAVHYPWSLVMYKMLITMAACFAVALLCRLLSEQERRAKKELMMMEDRVKRVEKMAAMGEMAAGLAHEIRNPLASLAGSIQLLKEDVQHNPDHKRLMQIVLRETERLNSLVRNFLLFARPSTGNVETVNLHGAVSDIVSLFEKDRSSGNHITITKRLHPDIWVEIDPGHLRQVLWNLLVNAAEAIDAEGTIEVELYREGKGFACIGIADDGCGMSRALMQQIFDPFFTTKSQGTGLGLSIVHSILESYDGILDVESDEGKGTKVCLKLKQVMAPA